MKQNRNKKIDALNNDDDVSQETIIEMETESRRGFLKSGLASGASVATLGMLASAATGDALADDNDDDDDEDDVEVDFSGRGRAVQAAKLKSQAAIQHLRETQELPKQRISRDEERYSDERYYASFTKTLPSNRFGEVRPGAFRKLVRAMDSGKKSDFDAIPLASSAQRRLENPQGALRFEVSALDSHATRIDPSFRLRGRKGAGEIGEVYWQAITRDVPFIDYQNSSMISAAVNDLNRFTKTPGAVSQGGLNADNLFRGETPGDLNGPYVSQFLLRPFNYGPSRIEQRYAAPVTGQDFMTDESNWLHVQRGGAPLEAAAFDALPRYIYNNRTLGEYVHTDVLYQAYQYAALIILGLPGGAAKFDAGNPYFNGSSTNQTGFSSLGGPQILDMVTRVAVISLTGAWYQKFKVHRFLRPEAYGARLHFHMTGQRDYELNREILNSDALNRVFSANGTYLCPQAFVEGSPTHPSYPAGHATIAGACVTVLKAFFNEDFVLSDNVQANADGTALLPYTDTQLTLGDELNKLANNVSIGRNAAGVHYRQDGVQGMFAGEQQAIAYLQDQSRTYNESDFGGFTFTKFDGVKVLIKDGSVYQV